MERVNGALSVPIISFVLAVYIHSRQDQKQSYGASYKCQVVGKVILFRIITSMPFQWSAKRHISSHLRPTQKSRPWICNPLIAKPSLSEQYAHHSDHMDQDEDANRCWVGGYRPSFLPLLCNRLDTKLEESGQSNIWWFPDCCSADLGVVGLLTNVSNVIFVPWSIQYYKPTG